MREQKMHALGVCSVLLVFLCLQFVAASKEEKTQFNLHIYEKGTRFNEKVRISEKQNTVSFMVPKHNDVDRSEVLNDFKLNLTITRVPDKGICHIKPLERGLSKPSEIKSSLNYMKNSRARMKGMPMMVSSTEWTFDKRLKRKDVNPSVAKFCSGLPIYRLREIIDDDMVIVQGNDNDSRRKRQLRDDIPMCDILSSSPCAGKWFADCKFKRVKTCVYWMKCKVPVDKVINAEDCKFTHSYNSLICCNYVCQ